MKKLIKDLLPQPVLDFYWDYKRKQIHKVLINEWIRQGKPLPPPHAIKQQLIEEYARRFGTDTLVETGTFRGDMVEAQRRNFRRIYSIELSPELFAKAADRFRRFKHITIIQGDSAKKLKEVTSMLKSPALFWLDGHYSGGDTAKGSVNCPIFGELDTIFTSPYDHVLVIDDARDFNGTNDYPTIGALRDFVTAKRQVYMFEQRNNMLCFYPPK